MQIRGSGVSRGLGDQTCAGKAASLSQHFICLCYTNLALRATEPSEEPRRTHPHHWRHGFKLGSASSNMKFVRDPLSIAAFMFVMQTLAFSWTQTVSGCVWHPETAHLRPSKPFQKNLTKVLHSCIQGIWTLAQMRPEPACLARTGTVFCQQQLGPLRLQEGKRWMNLQMRSVEHCLAT